jgi:predicted phage terminase large subunit-like protein
MRRNVTRIKNPQYIRGMAYHLQAITDPASLASILGYKGNPEDLRIRHLLEEIEPRTGKSDLKALWAAWEWGPRRMTWCRHLVGSHKAKALQESSEALMRLIRSNEYQARFPWVRPDRNSWNWQRLGIEGGGGRELVAYREGIQGMPGHRLVADDLIARKDVDSAAIRRRASAWFDADFRSRGIEKSDTPTVLSGQRVHQLDPIGTVIATDGLRSQRLDDIGYSGLWDRLTFQTEYTGPIADTALTRARVWADSRKQGEPIREEWTQETMARQKRKTSIWWSQHQQQPRSGQDSIWKRWWWKFWHYSGEPRHPVLVRLPDGTEREIPCEPLPKQLDRQIQSWDLAFKATATSSAVAGSVWGQKGSAMYWLHARQAKLDILGSISAIVETSSAWPETTAKLVEDKANGPAVEALLKGKVPGLLMIQPQGSKAQRAGAASDLLEAGNVYLPHPSLAPWVSDWLDWCDQWTGASDSGTDLLDTASQALLWLSKHASQVNDRFELSELDPWHALPKGSRWEDSF